MKLSHTCLLVSGFLTLLALPLDRAQGDPVTEAHTGEQVAVSLRAVSTQYNPNGTYGSTSSTGDGDTFAIPGGPPVFVYVGTGGFGNDGRPMPFGMCMNDTGAAAPENAAARKAELLQRDADLWWAEIRALPARIGRVALEVTWDHHRSDRQGSPIKVAGDTRRIFMNEGEHHVLDFHDEVPGKESYCYRNQYVEVSAVVKEDPELESRRLHYDLWLEHRTADGKKIHRRVLADAKQGEQIVFGLPALRFEVPGIIVEDGRGMDAILEVEGSIRGRLRRDGRIEMRLQALRWVSVAKAGDPRSGGIGEGADETVSVSPGETISLPLPPPHGSVGLAHPQERIDAKEFFAGAKDEMILTVTESR